MQIYPHVFVDETPVYLPVRAASQRTGLDPAFIRNLTQGDCPAIDELPMIQSTYDRYGNLLVHFPDLMIFVEAIEDGCECLEESDDIDDYEL